MKIIIKENQALALEASKDVEDRISKSIAEKGTACLVLGTGNSQLKFLDSLRERAIDWRKVIIFHLDEYIGISDDHPAGFVRYLREKIIQHIQPLQFHPIISNENEVEETLNNYTQLLKEHPIDVACVGIGENGHLAFNDPGVADFKDQQSIKVVELDHECRMQQLNEGWFDRLGAVPKTAITLTIPTIMNAKHISCFVPDQRKAIAVKNALEGEINSSCPASILRKHPSVHLYLDPPSATLLSNH